MGYTFLGAYKACYSVISTAKNTARKARFDSGGSRRVLVVSTKTLFEILSTEISNLNTSIEQSDRDSLIEQSDQDTLLQ